MSHPHPDRLAQLASLHPPLHVFESTDSNAFDMALTIAAETSSKQIVRVIRGKKCRTTKALFDEFAAAWQFPPYFGENWNALIDCLSDLDWIEADLYLAMIVDARQLLADEGPESFGHLADALDTVAKRWRSPTGQGDRGASFLVVFQADTPDRKAMADRLKATGVEFNVI